MGNELRVSPPERQVGDAIRDSALGLTPAILERYIPLSRSLWTDGPLSPDLLEMARLRNARKVDCVFCRSARYQVAREAGLDESRVAEIRDGYEHGDLSHREKLVLAYVDQYLDDPAGMSDELKKQLTDEFTAEEIVHLSLALLLFNTFSRFAVSMGGMPDELPVMEVPLPE